MVFEASFRVTYFIRKNFVMAYCLLEANGKGTKAIKLKVGKVNEPDI